TGCINVNTCCHGVVACGEGTRGEPYDGSGIYNEHDGGGLFVPHDGNEDRRHPTYVCVPETPRS
ncbi:MAG: hypothetical protein RIC89_10615, partial [Pseudomonadales bacterium]